jgi:hypothetical protein
VADDLTPTAGAETTTARRSAWGRLPTGAKMLLILSLGLLPFGIAAIYASVENARANRVQGVVQARALLTVHAQRLSLSLSRTAYTIRAARDAIAEAQDPAGICERTLIRLARLRGAQGRYAIFGAGGRPRCLSQGFVAPPVPRFDGASAAARLLPDGRTLRIFLYDRDGAVEGAIEYDRAELARTVDTPPLDGAFGLELVQGDRIMPLRAIPRGGALDREIVVDEALGTGQYMLRLHTAIMPLSPAEILAILAPVLMWLWASIIGWLLVERLLLRPLRRLEKVVSAYRPGDRPFDAPAVRSPAHEIAALGAAFTDVTRTVARHEADLEAAVARQTRLVREVHHRVKNNLQVVASLLNLHSRGSANEDVAAAYASIQRRVDALAVVHRNHYAEFEANRGVALKPLVSELAANLRASAPAKAAHMQIRLDVAPLNVTQDVAVSVAFLITEIAEFGMLCGARDLSIAVDPVGDAAARIEITSRVLAGDVDCGDMVVERFERVIAGLARQLRSTLERDPTQGRYVVTIAAVA